MVYGTPDRDPYRYAPGRCWVDVPTAQAKGYWVREEGRRTMRRILEQLRTEGGIHPEQDVYVISPFRKVVDGARAAPQPIGPLPASIRGPIRLSPYAQGDAVRARAGDATCADTPGGKPVRSSSGPTGQGHRRRLAHGRDHLAVRRESRGC